MNLHRLNQLFCFLIGLSLFSACQPTAKKTADTAVSATPIGVIGTYTRKEGHVDGKGEGVYFLLSDDSTRVAAKELINPSYVTISNDQQNVYAVEEIGPGTADTVGYITAFTYNNGALTKINRQSSHGYAPCYVTTDADKRCAFLANYVSGTVALYPLEKNGGLLPASDVKKFTGKGAHPRQDASHPHSTVLSKDQRFLYVPDLGLDRINVFEIDYAKGTLNPANPAFVATAPAAGPRHFAFHPTLSRAYVINELNNTIAVYEVDEKSGKLTSIQTISTLPADFKENNNTSDIHLTPNGAFLYGANRGHNSLAGYAVDAKTGMLTLLGYTSTHGLVPRNFALTPDGKKAYAANQNSDNIAIFTIDEKGGLQFTKEIKTPTPVCIQFLR
jgi:6-phosphogluconolactonase